MTRREAVQRVLAGRQSKTSLSAVAPEATAFAPSNIALVKYWGKRDLELRLPHNSSLSISLGSLGTETTIQPAEQSDRIFLGGERVQNDSSFAVRIVNFLNLFRVDGEPFLTVHTSNNIPMGSGVASSASGFAALTLALDRYFGWGLGRKELSIFARLGSGSATRSLFDGFVEWRKGSEASGDDSFAEPLEIVWPEFCIGLVVVSNSEKQVSSSEGMERTVRTSPFYEMMPSYSERDLKELKDAIRKKDFLRVGEISEANALRMHALMLSAHPSILYWSPETLRIIQEVWNLRRKQHEVYLTIDAGPNVVLIFPRKARQIVESSFPQVHIVEPFTPR